MPACTLSAVCKGASSCSYQLQLCAWRLPGQEDGAILTDLAVMSRWHSCSWHKKLVRHGDDGLVVWYEGVCWLVGNSLAIDKQVMAEALDRAASADDPQLLNTVYTQTPPSQRQPCSKLSGAGSGIAAEQWWGHLAGLIYSIFKSTSLSAFHQRPDQQSCRAGPQSWFWQ